MIVMHQKIPVKKKLNANEKPPNKNQIMLRIACLPKFAFTVEPKGQKDNLANLKHCKPNGIPMMVMHHMIPRKKYIKPVHKPVNKSHKMFPINFIPYSFFFDITII